MAANKNTMSYLNKTNMTDAEYKKAVAALNMRIRRVNASKFYKISQSLKEIDKFKTVVTSKNYSGNFNKGMVTSAGNFSSSLKNFTAKEKKLAKDFIKDMLKRIDLTVPEVKSITEKRAKSLGATVDEYLERQEFWEAYRDVKANTQYGSDEVFNAIEIAEATDESYEGKIALAQKVIDEYRTWQTDDRSAEDLPVIAEMSGEELLRKMSKAVTNNRVKRRSIRKG